MPELPSGGYLLAALQKLGPARQAGMGGLRPVDWPEIVAFSQGTGRITEPWEIELIFDMGQEYLSGKTTGDKLFGIAPIDQAEEAENPDD